MLDLLDCTNNFISKSNQPKVIPFSGFMIHITVQFEYISIKSYLILLNLICFCSCFYSSSTMIPFKLQQHLLDEVRQLAIANKYNDLLLLVAVQE